MSIAQKRTWRIIDDDEVEQVETPDTKADTKADTKTDTNSEVEEIVEEVVEEDEEIEEEPPKGKELTGDKTIDSFDEKTQQAMSVDKKGRITFNGRSFHIVVNPKSAKALDKIIDYLVNLKQFQYILVGQHKLEKDKHGVVKEPHYHIYIQYSDSEKLALKPLMGAHVKQCFRGAFNNIRYIRCQDGKEKHKHCKYTEYYQLGFPRFHGGCITTQDIIDRYIEDPNFLNQTDSRYYRVYKQIIDDYERKQAFAKWRNNVLKGKNAIKVDWHIGKGGSGKTFTAAQETTDNDAIIDFTKDGQFANILGDVEHAKTIILNEFKDSTIDFKTFLALLVNEKIVNIKGSQIYPTCVQKIIVTSQQRPDQIYRNCGEDRSQIYRRIDHVYEHYIENNEFKMREVPIMDETKVDF